MMWRVPKTKIRYKIDPIDGPLVSTDGIVWLFIYRGLEEFNQMHPTLEKAN